MKIYNQMELPGKLSNLDKKNYVYTVYFLHFSGGVITLVYLFCNAQDQAVREKAADVLCKMSSDKLMGPKVRIALSKFLPEIFLDAMKKSVEACLQMFESSHENPELIWNDDSRKRLTTVSKNLAER